MPPEAPIAVIRALFFHVCGILADVRSSAVRATERLDMPGG